MSGWVAAVLASLATVANILGVIAFAIGGRSAAFEGF